MGLSLRRARSGGSWASAQTVQHDLDVKPLTASGYRVTRRTGEQQQLLQQQWQDRAFFYYDVLGPIKYAAQFYARAMSLLRLCPEWLDDKGDWVERNDNLIANSALERVQDPGGGRSGLLGAYGRLMFLVGECILFVTTDAETGLEQWEMLSTREVRKQGEIWMRQAAPSLSPDEYRAQSDDDYAEVGDKTAVGYRLWQRHPLHSRLADATMQGALDDCEELVMLNRSVRSRTRSRLAGPGILFIDERISPKPPQSNPPKPAEDAKADKFLQDLMASLMKPIGDEGSAAAVTPFLVRVPVPDQPGLTVRDMVAHIQILDPTQLYPEAGLRRETIERIAISLDMPAEVLTGLGDVNHWGAWQVDEQTWKAHLQPKADQFRDDVTSSYYRPALEAAGLEDWERWRVGYDAAAVVNHPDRSDDARQAYRDIVIGKRAYREAINFSEDDAPTDEERAERIGILTHDSSLAWYGEPTVKTGGVEVGPGVIVNADDTGPGAVPSEPGAGSGAEVEKGPPGDGEPPGGAPPRFAHDAYRIVAAAQLEHLRCRERAGSRVRSHANRDPAARDRIDGVRAGDVCATLGQEAVRALRCPPEAELVLGSRPLIEEALRAWGIRDDALAATVADNVEAHAARTLYELRPAPLPAPLMNHLLDAAAAAERADAAAGAGADGRRRRGG